MASAQVKSSLLLAALFAKGTTQLSEPRLSRDHTERLFAFFGLPLVRKGLTLTIEGRPSVGWGAAPQLTVPGDFSAAAFFIVGATILPGSDVTITGVGINPTRTGLLDVLDRMDDVHQQFIEAVAEGRALEPSTVQALADGRIFTGRQAKEARLVDELGNLDDAIQLAADLAGIEGEPKVVEPRRRFSIRELLESRLSSLIPKLDFYWGVSFKYLMAF